LKCQISRVNDPAVSVKPSTTGNYFSCTKFINKIQCYQPKQSFLITLYILQNVTSFVCRKCQTIVRIVRINLGYILVVTGNSSANKKNSEKTCFSLTSSNNLKYIFPPSLFIVGTFVQVKIVQQRSQPFYLAQIQPCISRERRLIM
jgi:hypothetical protein